MLCLVVYGFHQSYVILGGFVWISWIPGGSGVSGLIFNGSHQFEMIFNGFVWIPWIPGARGRTSCGILWERVGSESGPYGKFGQISGSMTSMTR